MDSEQMKFILRKLAVIAAIILIVYLCLFGIKLTFNSFLPLFGLFFG